MSEAAAEFTRHPTAKEMARNKRLAEQMRLEAPHGHRLSRTPHKPVSLIDAFEELRMMADLIGAGFGVEAGLNERECAAFTLMCRNLSNALDELSAEVHSSLTGLFEELEQSEAKRDAMGAFVKNYANGLPDLDATFGEAPDLSEPISSSDAGAALAG